MQYCLSNVPEHARYTSNLKGKEYPHIFIELLILWEFRHLSRRHLRDSPSIDVIHRGDVL